MAEQLSVPHKILVVDDEPDLELLIRQRFRKQIRENLFSFEFAGNGIQALQVLEKNPGISVVLSDINMPEMDGLTLLQKLQELENPALKSVIISAYGDMENIRTAMNRGAFDFLTKPINFEDLDLTVSKTLDQIEVIRAALQSRDQLISVQRDLSIATRIQLSLLPRKFPPFPDRKEVELFAEMVTAKEVGGDFYDFYFLDQDRLGFVIGDVSGKGIPAAIYMAVSRTLLKAIAHQIVHPGEVLRRLNDLLIPESEATTFVTIFYGVLNTRTGDVQYANAGHNPPYLMRKGGTVEQLPLTDGMLVGKIENLDYDAKKIQLMPGDALFLYTDGVTEAMNAESDLYDDTRLLAYLKNTNGASLEEIAKGNIEDIHTFVGTTPQSDDITVLALRYTGLS